MHDRAAQEPRARPLVIGLTGPNGAGKGEIAAMLRDSGYAYLSLSDLVREEARRRGLEPVRENLIRVGRDLRREHGSGVLARRARERIEAPCVVDSVRNPGEVAQLRELDEFFLIGVTADARTRFARMQDRGRPGDAQTLEEFLERERIEDSDDEEGQRAGATLALADLVLRNDDTLEVLEAKLRDALRELQTRVAASGGR